MQFRALQQRPRHTRTSRFNVRLPSSKTMHRYTVAFIVVTALAGCSSRQAYGVGQAWQRNECFKIADQQERSRCLASAATSFEQYKKETEAVAGKR